MIQNVAIITTLLQHNKEQISGNFILISTTKLSKCLSQGNTTTCMNLASWRIQFLLLLLNLHVDLFLIRFSYVCASIVFFDEASFRMQKLTKFRTEVLINHNKPNKKDYIKL